jgi:nickel-dependent lactate racemase
VIGSVEPHYFAGYTGGRKSILPGCAAYSSIRENHFLACLEGSAPAVLDGNPVHCDMMEAARMLEGIVPAVHACCVVRGREGLSVSVGSLGSAFEACLPVANRYLCKEVDEEADILVLKPGSSLETNLYQSMKAVYNFETAVRTGGTILLDSRCTEGLGAPHMESVLLRAMDRDPVPEPDRDTYMLGEHSIARLARIRRRAVLALHSELDGLAAADLGFVPVTDPESWIAKAGGRVVEVEDAGSRAPMMKKARK